MTALVTAPTVLIRLAGELLEADLARCAVAVVVRQALNAPALAEVTFADPPADLLEPLRPGRELSLTLAPSDALFAGEVTAVEHDCDAAQGRLIRVRAFDKLHRLRKVQHQRAAPDLSVADLARQAAGDLGLAFETTESAPTRVLTIQHEQSDLDLLVELAGDAGLYLQLDGDTLRLMSLAGQGDPIALKLGDTLTEVRVTESAETIRSSARAKGWDITRAAMREGSPASPRSVADAAAPEGFDGLGERVLLNRVAWAADEVTALIQADVDHAAAATLTAEGTAEGAAALKPGRIITLEGVAPNADRRFVLTAVLHRIDAASGYFTEFSSVPPARRSKARAPALTFGKVTDVQDPDRLGRLRATLPAYDDLETSWMAVMVPGAGAEKGGVVMPERDDQVLIVFPDGDPSRGVVLGGLYGERQLPGDVADNARSFLLRSPGGQSFTLHGEKSLARLETKAGDLLEFTPDGTKIRSKTDLTIEAPGRRLLIRAASVAFEKG